MGSSAANVQHSDCVPSEFCQLGSSSKRSVPNRLFNVVLTAARSVAHHAASNARCERSGNCRTSSKAGTYLLTCSLPH